MDVGTRGKSSEWRRSLVEAAFNLVIFCFNFNILHDKVDSSATVRVWLRWSERDSIRQSGPGRCSRRGFSTVAVLQVPTSEAVDSSGERRRPTSRCGRAIGSKGHEALASRDEECSCSNSSSNSSSCSNSSSSSSRSVAAAAAATAVAAKTIRAADSRRPRASLLLVTCLPWWPRLAPSQSNTK